VAELMIAVARSVVDPRGRVRVDQDPEMEAARLKAVHGWCGGKSNFCHQPQAREPTACFGQARGTGLVTSLARLGWVGVLCWVSVFRRV
jgi:hypothetical protein